MPHNLKIKEIEPFEHLDDVIKNTTPYQRLKVLEEMWDFWCVVRRRLPKKIIELQDKFRQG
jgi:hypothetical protein